MSAGLTKSTKNVVAMAAAMVIGEVVVAVMVIEAGTMAMVVVEATEVARAMAAAMEQRSHQWVSSTVQQ